MMDALGTKREYMRHHHGRKINFIAPGVERPPRQRQGGLLYGTDDARTSGRYTSRICTEQTSWEKSKIQRQQKDAEDDIQYHKRNQQYTKHQMAEEKRKDLRLLQQYNPWGKPAPGAPRWTPSGSLLARGDAPISRQEDKTMDDEDNEFIDRYTPFGKPGAGAPLKSHDGHVDTSIRAHPETRFQKHLKKEVENSLRYKGAVEGQMLTQSHVTRTESEEDRESHRRSQQNRYAQRLEDQMEEALERKRQDTVKPPLSYFPWGQNSPRRDDSGKLLSRRQPRPPPPQNEFQSIVEHIERIGKRRQPPSSHCTHPFTHGSQCQLNSKVRSQKDQQVKISPKPISNRISKQSHSLPVTMLQHEADERERHREEARKRNSHHTLWDGGY